MTKGEKPLITNLTEGDSQTLSTLLPYGFYRHRP